MSGTSLRHYDPAVMQVSKSLELAKETGASKEVIESIEKALLLSELRDEYAENTTTNQSEGCAKILKETFEHDWKGAFQAGKTIWNLSPGMMSGTLVGQMLKSIVSATKAKRALDIGMYTGYSCMSMAEALPVDGQVVTVEMDKYLEPFVNSIIKDSPHYKKVKIMTGKALDVMKTLVGSGEKFDIIFLDATKSEYESYINICFEENLLAPGGTVLVDNAFVHGKGYHPDEKDDTGRNFAKALQAMTKLHKVLIPIRDGVCIIRRLSDVEGAAP